MQCLKPKVSAQDSLLAGFRNTVLPLTYGKAMPRYGSPPCNHSSNCRADRQTDRQEINLMYMQPRQSKHKHFSYQCLGEVQAKPEAEGDIHFSLLLLKSERTWGRSVRDPEAAAINAT